MTESSLGAVGEAEGIPGRELGRITAEESARALVVLGQLGMSTLGHPEPCFFQVS